MTTTHYFDMGSNRKRALCARDAVSGKFCELAAFSSKYNFFGKWHFGEVKCGKFGRHSPTMA
jgi:hypothetical protein